MIEVSTGFKAALYGSSSFSSAFLNGCIELYDGTMPGANNAPTGTLIGRITLNGGTYVHGSPGNALYYELTVDGLILKPVSAVWVLTGLAEGTATWGRIFSGADTKLLSSTDPRIDFEVNPIDGSGWFLTTPAPGVSNQYPVTYFLFGIPPFL